MGGFARQIQQWGRAGLKPAPTMRERPGFHHTNGRTWLPRSRGLGRSGVADQVVVDRVGGVAALGDRPDDQALAAGHVAGGEDLLDARPLVRVGLDVAHRVELDAELLEHPLALGADEAHRQQDEVGGVHGLGPGDLDELGAAVLDLHLDPDGLQALDAAVLAEEAPGVDRVFALAPFLVGGGDAEDVRPLRPGVVRDAGVRGAGDDLELVDAEAALAVDGPQAVGAGVAAADDDHALALRRDEVGVGDRVAGDPLVLEREEVHREVDAVEVAAGDRQVARPAVAPPQRQTASNSARRRSAGRSTPMLTPGRKVDPLGLHLRRSGGRGGASPS